MRSIQYSWLLLLFLLSVKSYGSTDVALDTLQLIRVNELVKEGEHYERQYNTYHALLCYDAALQLDSTPPIVRKVAQCQFKRGYYDHCIQTLEKLNRDSINHQDMRLKYNCYSNLDHKELAIYWGKKIADQYPYDSDVIVKMASHYNTTEQPDSALYFTQNYKKNDSTNIFVNRQHAFSFYIQGNYAEALAEYRKLLSLNDHTASVYYYTGLSYAKCDSMGLAYDYLLESAKLHDFKNPHVLSQLGVICIGLGIPDEGIGYIQEAIALFQPDDNLMFTLTKAMADGYFKRNKYTECALSLKKSLEYNPSSIYTLYRLGQVYGLMKNTSLENKYYQNFIEKAESKKSVQTSLKALVESAKVRVKSIEEENFFKGKAIAR